MRELKWKPDSVRANIFYAIAGNSQTYWVYENSPANVEAFIQDNKEGSSTLLYSGDSKLAAINTCEECHKASFT
jgi:hypothetical protein